MKQQNCEDHGNPIEFMCLDEECKDRFLLCKGCHDSNPHKHSKTSIVEIDSLKQQLKQAWELENNPVSPYGKKIKSFYEKLRKQINEVIDQDERNMNTLVQKIKYHHLPKKANSQAYINFKKHQFNGIDKNSMITLINEAENGEINKDHQQKQLLDILDTELAKINDKVRTFKFVLPSTKFQTQLLIPRFSEDSAICSMQDLAKIYGIFNSRSALIRSSKLIYRASENQFCSKEFYNNSNDVYNCLTVAKLQNNKLIGAFSSSPLVYPEEQQLVEDSWIYGADSSKKNFLFSLTNMATFQLRDSNKAIAYEKDAIGPIFGKDLNLSKIKAESELGNSYRCPEGLDPMQTKVYLLGGQKVKIKDFEVWQLSF